MPHSRWISRSTLLIAGVCAAAALTACGSESSPAPTESSTTAAASATTSRSTPTTQEVSDASAAQLCDMLRPELTNWRIQGGTLGKIGLNALVHEWALRNGAINAAVLADKAIVDRAAIKSCPDVRQQAIDALGIPDLASGLVF